MRIGKEVKRDTQLIIISVIILTIVMLSFSYSAFFTVQSLSTVQEITTGNLNVTITIDNTNSIIQDGDIFPLADKEIEDGTGGNYSTLTLVNEGDLDADFSATISYDFDKLKQIDEYSNMSNNELLDYLVSFDYLKIGIYDVSNNNWVNFSGDNGTTYYTLISGLTPSSSSNYTYPILRDVVYSKESNSLDSSKQYQKVFKIYVWLSDETPISEIGKYVYLKLNVKSAAGNEVIDKEISSGSGEL